MGGADASSARLRDETESALDVLTAEGFSELPVYEPVVENYDPTKDRELMRGVIALSLVVLLVLIVLAPIGVVIWVPSVPFETIKSMLELILSPVVALVGSAVGFYFGGKEK